MKICKYFVLLSAAACLQSVVAADAVFRKPLSASNQTAFEATVQQLKVRSIVKSDYRQVKRIRALKRPLRTRGTLLFVRKLGLVWSASHPFRVTFVLTSKGIVQKEAGAQPIRITAREQPVIYEFSQTFLSLFDGNVAQLKNYFEIYFSGKPEKWKMGLVPRDSKLKPLVTSLVVSGGTTIRRITIIEGTSDTTEIEFRKTRASKREPNKSERQLFED